MTTTVLQFLEPTKNFKVTKKETIGLELSDISLLTKNIKNKSSYINGKYIIIGVPDDRGIIENGGNPGAKQGPDVFRLCFYKLYDTQVQKFNKSIDSYDDNQTISKKNPEFISNYFFDAGNIILADSILETHDRLASVVEFFLNHGAKLIFVIGGGHDFSYGSYKGHVASRKNEIIPIINFDAHFDLRPVEDNKINRGG
jgi:formiminoglutamase